VTAINAEGEGEARRNALVLMVATALSSAGTTIMISLSALAGAFLLGADKSLATFPVTCFNIGVAGGAVPAAALMRRVGRRTGFIAGTAVAMLGGVFAGVALLVHAYALFAFGTFGLGIAGAFVQQYRFAAADVGSAEMRARAISWVLVGGVIAGILGSQVVIATRDLLLPTPYAGSFFAIVGLGIAAALVLTRLTGAARGPLPAAAHGGGRPLSVIVRQRRFIVAVVCGVASYGLMSLVMTAAPLAMVNCGISTNNVALGIQWHVLAMYAPSFFTGLLIVRFGKEPIVVLGLVLLVSCALLALAGIDLLHFWGALILLGLGWNFSFIGATDMLTETYRPEERSRAQGLNDLFVFGAAAVGSLSSGGLLAFSGWAAINMVVFPVVGIAALALLADLMGRSRSQLPA
jgi:MFS family permease